MNVEYPNEKSDYFKNNVVVDYFDFIKSYWLLLFIITYGLFIYYYFFCKRKKN